MSHKTGFNLIKKIFMLFSMMYLGIMLIATICLGAENDKQVIKGKDGAEMVLIPAGEFQMGSNDGFRDQTKNLFILFTLMPFIWIYTR